MRSTLTDVAREAGVSSATVDRVLNDRAGVSHRTRNVVLEVAQRLGYIANDHALLRTNTDLIRLDFILPSGTNPFIAALLAEILEQAAVAPALDVHVRSIEGFNPDSLARALRELKGVTTGVGVIALDHPTVSEAIRSLSADGIKVATLVSDIHHVPRIGYVGIDNRAAGRLAGYLLGRFLEKGKKHKVALFAGSLSYRGHEEREMGFRNIVSEEYGELEILALREVKDDRERAHLEASSLLEHHPDLSAIYNIGAGTSGIARALQEVGRERSVVFVGHDLTESNKANLLNGTLDALIDQNPQVEAREVLAMLSCAVRGQSFTPHVPRLQVIFKENIPESC